MITVQETTKWDGPYDNHKYILSDDRRWMYAFIRNGEKYPKIFNRPIGFEARGRTFVVLHKTKDYDPSVEVIYVNGSKGNQYTVTKEDGRYRCSCPAFAFRHTCKHITGISEQAA